MTYPIRLQHIDVRIFVITKIALKARFQLYNRAYLALIVLLVNY